MDGHQAIRVGGGRQAGIWHRVIHSSMVRLAVALALLLAALTQLTVTFTSLQLSINGASSAIQSLPVSQAFTGRAALDGELRLPRVGGALIHIVPDEKLIALEINHRAVDLSRYSAEQLADWHNGFNIDLAPYAQRGSNHFHLLIDNQHGPGGVNIEYVPIGIAATAPFTALCIGFGLIWYLLAGAFGLSRALLLIGLFSITWVCLYWFQTPYATRQFDIFESGGHLDYLRYLASHWRLPPPVTGWEYHQPPLYYLTALPALLIGNALPRLGVENLLRVISMRYWLLFLASGLAIIQLYLRQQRTALLLAAFAFCCWPSGFIHSIRTGNDVAFYAGYTCGLWAACLWWRSHANRHFQLAVMCCGLAILSKSNGLALAAVLLGLLCVRWWRVRQRPATELTRQNLWRCSRQLTVMVTIAVGVSFATKMITYLHGQAADWLLADVGNTINPGLRVVNSWRHLLGFDGVTFISQHWLSPWDDRSGRQYFWNYLLRSALSSEFSFTSRLDGIALLSGVLLMLLCTSALLRLTAVALHVVQRKNILQLRLLYRLLPLLFSGSVLILLLLAYRVKAPYASNNDFRYIYPALLSLLIIDAALSVKRNSLNSVSRWCAPLIGMMGVLWVLLL